MQPNGAHSFCRHTTSARISIAASVRSLAVVVTAALCVAGCAVSAEVGAPAPEREVNELALADPSSSERPSSDPSPTGPASTSEAAPAPAPTLVSTAALAGVIETSLAELDALGLTYSFRVGAPDGSSLVDVNGRQDLLPASNQKIVTATGALAVLDEEFRFQTELRVDPDGNVFVVGGGDPTFTSRDVVSFAAAVIDELGVARQVGPLSGTVTDQSDTLVETVIGDVVVDPRYFPATRRAPGWPDRYVPTDVGPMSGLWIDNNQHRGDEAYLNDPDTGNAQLVAEIFAQEGILVTGVARAGSVPANARTIDTVRSPKRDRLIDVLLGRSDNEIGEALVRQVSLAQGGSGETPDGQAAIYAWLADQGIDLGDPVGDGSGLSRDNRLSAADLVGVLAYGADQPYAEVIWEGLAAAGTDGTLAQRLNSDTTVGNVRAKTGTLDDARSLSGVVTTYDSHELIFAIVVNGEDAPVSVRAMDRIVVALSSATLDQLEELGLG